MTKEQLRADQNLPLLAKIEKSKEIIRTFYKMHSGKVYVGYSGGKDSTDTLHIARSVYPDMLAVFTNTTNEKDEILEYVKNTKNVKTLLPKKGFIWTLKNCGFPFVSKLVCKQVKTFKNPTANNVNLRYKYLTGYSKKGSLIKSSIMAKRWYHLIEQDFNISSECCKTLKHEPAERFEKETGMRGIIGIMAEESEDREQVILTQGYISADRCRPLGFWTEKDVWDYAKMHKIRFAENYYDRYVNEVFIKADRRSGCRFCFMGFARELTKRNRGNLFYQNRLQIEKITNTKYDKLMMIENNGVTVKDALKITFGLKEGEL